ncbi:DUF3343 domain-containing protein [Anoxynatronum sibiricum]|uniref:DUF3343 domain-containing protein n=1 Tax=Anoxynatronum sibiricum TaxID=210623 RepID=A0ABU9VUV3_9CLOT
MNQWLLVFDSTHHAMAAESRLKEKPVEGLVFQMIPTPRQITASCGLSLLLNVDDIVRLQQVRQMLADHRIEWVGLYRKEADKENPWRQCYEDC